MTKLHDVCHRVDGERAFCARCGREGVSKAEPCEPPTTRQIHRAICAALADAHDEGSVVVFVAGLHVRLSPEFARLTAEDLRDLCEKALLLEELERVLPVELTDVAKRLRAKRLER